MSVINEIVDKLAMFLSMSMVQLALIVSVFIALSSSLLGVTLVLKRYSLIGNGLSNVAFGAMAIAAAVRMTNNYWIVLPVTIITAVLLLTASQNSKIKGDAAIAMISVSAMGLGYLIMSQAPRSSNMSADVCEVLFGGPKILTLQSRMGEVWLTIILSLIVVGVFLLFYHKIFAVTFDEDFSAATGVRAKLYNLILSVIIAVIIVLAMNLVGALLISALVVFPAMSAMRVFRTFKSVTICAVIFSIICTTLGILISIIMETPVGATIVAADVAGFIVFSLIGFAVRRAS